MVATGFGTIYLGTCIAVFCVLDFTWHEVVVECDSTHTCLRPHRHAFVVCHILVGVVLHLDHDPCCIGDCGLVVGETIAQS